MAILDPSAQLTITTADLPNGIVGGEYVAELRAAGGQPPLEWSVEGQVPPGLELTTGESILMTGTPTAAGAYPLVFEVRDGDGLVDRNAYVVDIIEEGALTIVTGQSVSDRLPAGTVDQPYLTEDGMPVRLRAAPAGGLTWSVVSGRLPAGLQLAPDGGISGTPTESGAFAFTVLVLNAANDLRRATLALVVNDPPAPIADDTCSCRAVDARSSGPGAGYGRWRWSSAGDGGVDVGVIDDAKGALRNSNLDCAIAVAVSPTAEAQSLPSPYIALTDVRPYRPLSAGVPVMPSVDDSRTVQLDLPFSVSYFGASYRTLYINANGFIAFAVAANGFNAPPQTIPEHSCTERFPSVFCGTTGVAAPSTAPGFPTRAPASFTKSTMSPSGLRSNGAASSTFGMMPSRAT